jgi:hypothetical protein
LLPAPAPRAAKANPAGGQHHPSGVSCAGSGGANLLLAETLPCSAAPTARATGMPKGGLAVHVAGLAPTWQPLQGLVPQDQAACALLVQPEVYHLLVPQQSTVEVAFAIPDSAALIGAIAHEQVLAFDIASGAIDEVTSTNRLSIVLGDL